MRFHNNIEGANGSSRSDKFCVAVNEKHVQPAFSKNNSPSSNARQTIYGPLADLLY